VQTAQQILAMQGKLINQVPEVASVFGKAGRALSATDPAPLEMIETVINLKPEEEWRPGITAGFLTWPDLSVLLPAVAPRMIAMAGHNSNEKNSVLRFCNTPGKPG
jgi:Cu(I)/Ag(I) efflux system membrane protein CusA/SilA